MPDPSSASPPDEFFLRQFVAQERPLLRFILRFVPAPADARDVLQETVVTLWAKRGEFEAGRDFFPWACGIARYKVKEFWRKQPRWEAFAQEDLMELIDGRWEQLATEMSARGEQLRDCLARLPEDQRALLRGYYDDEEPIERLAEKEGRTTDAIYKFLQRIRRTLLECIERGLRLRGMSS